MNATFEAYANQTVPKGCQCGNNGGGDCEWCSAYYNGPVEGAPDLEASARKYADQLYSHCYQYTPLDAGKASEHIRQTDPDWMFFLGVVRAMVLETREAAARTIEQFGQQLVAQRIERGDPVAYCAGIERCYQDIVELLSVKESHTNERMGETHSSESCNRQAVSVEGCHAEHHPERPRPSNPEQFPASVMEAVANPRQFQIPSGEGAKGKCGTASRVSSGRGSEGEDSALCCPRNNPTYDIGLLLEGAGAGDGLSAYREDSDGK